MTLRIEISNLTKRFVRSGGKEVIPVDNISLSVEENELVVLLGPSGCGKTTLLRCVAGLERPDAGEIVIDGRVVFSAERSIFVPPEQRGVSMIFQSYALWPHMTVAQNVGYPLESRNLPAAVIRERVQEALRLVGIGGLDTQYPGRISGGQQQRVALARALVGNSSVVLFDEPLSNVDAQVRSQLRFELKRMQRQLGFSGLYVTHDQVEAMELGHRVAVLQSGRLAALDTPRGVYDNPPSRYVADFVGVSNFLPGTVRGTDGGTAIVETRQPRCPVLAGGRRGLARAAPGKDQASRAAARRRSELRRGSHRGAAILRRPYRIRRQYRRLDDPRLVDRRHRPGPRGRRRGMDLDQPRRPAPRGRRGG